DASPYIDYGARTYSPALRGWLSPDPLADKYFDLSPYAFCAGDPVNVVDPDGRDTVIVVDSYNRPKDNGTRGKTYTATVFVIIDGKIVGEYQGSSYPNSRNNANNSTPYNTIKEGEYIYCNKWGHHKGEQKGLNIVNSSGKRVAPAESPKGEDTIAWYINVHSGYSDNGNYNSRGSHGCITINPKDAEAFFSHFNWTNKHKTTGDSYGKILIYRTPTVIKMIKHENILVP
ncbi:MAG: L,D-transpeptidase family protein, partial [Bacteroidales bacterium]|nr:L,D-transpeptidase family protein [Bacteroidales bacterium]